MISRYFSKITGTKCFPVLREIEDYVLSLDLLAILSLHYIFTYVLRYVMISDEKISSPIVRCSMKNVWIEESEVESSECDAIESIPESPCVALSPIFEVFLKIKPKAKEISNDEIHVNPSSYEILDSTTLRTKFTPIGSAKTSRSSRPSSTVSKKFTFSKIFEPQISQAEFFEQTVKPKVVEFLIGQSSTIMTYGATNSGKTYTLYGTPDQPGIIPRSIEYIFSAITCTLMPWYKFNPNNTLISLDDYERSEESNKKDKLLRSQLITKDKSKEARRSLENSEQSNENKECYGESMYAVWLTFVEIYNENIYDLLDFDDSTKSRPLKLISEKTGLTHAKGLTTIYATTAFEACQILMAGQSRISTAYTDLNPKSSRSHTIFTMGLLKYQKAYAPHEAEASTLTFCDLAAPGRSKQTNECKTRQTETRNINNSLLVLGRCLKTVYEKQSTKQGTDHVSGPFRESKLTRIFQRALSGHEHVTFLINIDPSSDLVNETQSILNISAIAGKISSEIKESKKSARETTHCSKLSARKTHVDDFQLLNSTFSEDKENQGTNKVVVSSEKGSVIQEENLKTALLKRELEVRQELANYYNSVIERIEETWKQRMKEVEEEGKDLLKWSVDQIENLYEERMEGIMYAKKRKRDELSCDDKGEDSRLYEYLERQNIRATSKVCALKDALKKLQDEHRSLLAERNTDNFELALLRTELKDFRDLARSELSLTYSIDDDRDSSSLACMLKCLINDKNRRIQALETDLEDIRNKYVGTKDEGANLREEESSNSKDVIDELKEELSKKSTDLRSLSNKLECCEKELYQTEIACKDAENKNLGLLEKIEALDNIVRQMERKYKDSSMPRAPYYLEQALVKQFDCQSEQNDQNLNSRLSSITDDSFFGDATGEPGNFIVQAHIDIKKHNFDDRRNLSKGTSSNMSDVESKSLFDSSGNEFRSSDASSKNDSGIVVGTHFHSKVPELPLRSEYRDKKLFKEFELLKEENRLIIEKYKEVSKSLDEKTREYENDVYELREKLKIVEDSKDAILARLKTYEEENAYLECKSSTVRDQLDEVMADCRENHIERLEELEKELLLKTLEVDKAYAKVTVAHRDLEQLNDLTERLDKLQTVVDEYQKERDDLRDQLRERLEVQEALETKLKCFYSMIEERKDKLTSLEITAAIVDRTILSSKKIAMELPSKTTMNKKIASINSELLRAEESRKDIEKRTEREIDDLRSKLAILQKDTTILTRTLEAFDDKQNELIQIKNRLYEKEQEMSLFKENRDVTIKKYDFLVSQLQEELEKFRESSLADKESNSPVRMRPRFKVSESLKKFTRVGKSADGNWKSDYRRRKAGDEKSLASTSTFSVSKVSSSHGTNDHELRDETQSSQTESNVDSDNSDSRATSGTSDKTDDDFGATPCRFVGRSRASSWMRSNTRINNTRVLPVYSDAEHDGDRSDS